MLSLKQQELLQDAKPIIYGGCKDTGIFRGKLLMEGCSYTKYRQKGKYTLEVYCSKRGEWIHMNTRHMDENEKSVYKNLPKVENRGDEIPE